MAEMTRVAYVFPGQGTQYVGMGHDLYNNYKSARIILEEADKALDFSLSRLCFEGPEEELLQTINVQPAIVAVSLSLLAAARESIGNSVFPAPAFVAGHSLGEYSALAVSGVLSPTATVRLARERGRLMHHAGHVNPGGMMAIIGLDEIPLSEICIQTGTYIANFNCPGQLVISGTISNLDKAGELAKARGAFRAIPLQVSGAFHTHLMEPASQDLSKYLDTITFNDPAVPIIANTTAQEIITAESVKEELVNQLCHGVQWQRSIEFMINNGVDTFIEIGPGKVLSGLIKRINKKVRTINICDAESIKNLEIVNTGD
ncbi:MAG: ACP S-malonyltransferase [Dehalococcoidales bacterium]|nr:ACP S-malonyltransferase [Dehalococcoidales bacterium]